MIVSFFTAKAEKLYSKRWWFLTSSIGNFLLLGLILTATNINPFLIFALLTPFIIVPWGLLCMCTWFHPLEGNMQPNSKLFGKLPAKLQKFFQWYAAIFLAFFMIFGLVAFPLFAVFIYAA